MSKFDRCIFISIAIGIWALAMTQLFDSEIINAQTYHSQNMWDETKVVAKCPPHTTGRMFSTSNYNAKNCSYVLVVTYQDLLNHPDVFSSTQLKFSKQKD